VWRAASRFHGLSGIKDQVEIRVETETEVTDRRGMFVWT
jgi:hypothetical protein